MLEFFLTFMMLFAAFEQYAQSPADSSVFERHHFHQELPYRLLYPKNYQADKQYPLLLFLHGAGERGNENEVPLTHISPLLLDKTNRENYPCFALVPQCPEEARWVEVHWGLKAHQMPEKPSKPLQMTVELLDSLQQVLPIDTDRLYVTGLSMGGFGTWDLISRYPGKFAAAVPVCGGGDEAQAAKIKHLPIWAFHGALDQVVLPSRSRNMVEALQALGAKPRYTEYPKVYHGSWKPAYQEKELLAWLFAQKRQED